MRIKILSLFASALLVSACATEPEGSGTASGSGSSPQTTASGSGTSAAPTTQKAAPLGAPPGSGVDFYVNVGDRVFFDFNKSEIGAKAAGTLEKQAAWLQKYPNKTIVVEGHADERGTREYNLALGERRANAVRDYVVANGISSLRIETVSYGEERPVAYGAGDSNWTQNRRVELVKQ